MNPCCLKCVFCGMLYYPIDKDRHDICQDFYKYTLDEMIYKLEKQLQMCYEMRNRFCNQPVNIA